MTLKKMTYCVIFFIGYITFVNKEVSNLLAKHQRYILEGKAFLIG